MWVKHPLNITIKYISNLQSEKKKEKWLVGTYNGIIILMENLL